MKNSKYSVYRIAATSAKILFYTFVLFAFFCIYELFVSDAPEKALFWFVMAGLSYFIINFPLQDLIDFLNYKSKEE